ncbi:MAG: hypothetical protein IJ033_00515, partial [Clostridia bacterium]|nr:hypothetical protein [Clostridia bacterium]
QGVQQPFGGLLFALSFIQTNAFLYAKEVLGESKTYTLLLLHLPIILIFKLILAKYFTNNNPLQGAVQGVQQPLGGLLFALSFIQTNAFLYAKEVLGESKTYTLLLLHLPTILICKLTRC